VLDPVTEKVERGSSVVADALAGRRGAAMDVVAEALLEAVRRRQEATVSVLVPQQQRYGTFFILLLCFPFSVILQVHLNLMVRLRRWFIQSRFLYTSRSCNKLALLIAGWGITMCTAKLPNHVKGFVIGDSAVSYENSSFLKITVF
jgi:hypothetical protein